MLRSDDPQLLALEAAHLEHEPVGDVARRADRPARRRPVGEQPPAELERRRQLGRLGATDPRHRLELDVGRAGEARQALVPGERILGEVDRRPTRRAGAPDERDQLRGAESGRAARRETLTRTLVGRDLADGPSRRVRAAPAAGVVASDIGRS